MMNYLGKALFLVVFFFFISVFSNKTSDQSCSFQSSYYHLSYDYQQNPSKSAVSVDIKLPSFQWKWVTSENDLNILLFNNTDKILTDNNLAEQKALLIRNTQLKVKPIINCWFYHSLSSIYADELPILS